MKHLERQTEQLCNEMRKHPERPASSWAASVDAILKHLHEPRKRSPSAKLKGPTRKQDKAAADAQHALDWQAIKTAVLERARVESDGRCELGCGREINDPHHLISGSGKRRPNERFDTVIGICRIEHDAYEDGDLEVLEKIRKWAERHGYWMALGEVDRRIARIKRLRAATAAKGEG